MRASHRSTAAAPPCSAPPSWASAIPPRPTGSEYEAFRAATGELDPADPKLLDMHLLPDPDQVRIRVYGTQSTHKSMSALRQGSMILVRDQDFPLVHGAFEEAYFTHTSTSPNLQIIASLDLARRQMELEGYGLVARATDLALRIRRQVNGNPAICEVFSRAHARGDGARRLPRVGHCATTARRTATVQQMASAWDTDEIALDPDAADAGVRDGRLRRHGLQGTAGGSL